MCQLLGVSYSEPKPFNKLFAEFRKRGESNPHAWGVAYWAGDGHGPAVIREARTANESPLAAALASAPVPAMVIVGHVRLGTTSGKWSLRSTANAHPFLFRVGEADWAGAHNGYIRGIGPTVHHPVGTTDSEAFFCAVADELELSKAKLTEEKMDAVCRAAGKYQNSGKLNFLLSDGENLFFSANHPATVGGLYFREIKRSGQRALIVATRPLFTDEGWKEAEPGWLYVAREGRVVKKRRILPVFTGKTQLTMFAREEGPRAAVTPAGKRRYRSYIDYWEDQVAKKRAANYH
ncbi:class II glutamine amidotransferase [Neomoorella thermoacetica]|uniref:class II glutamine amidotransferase n=1 Tax=Neomoorella thermoacetica TaxID=1525 RepID=UPI0030D21FE9